MFHCVVHVYAYSSFGVHGWVSQFLMIIQSHYVTLQGVPVLEYVAGCQYIFEWDTNVVCERNNTDTAKGKCVYQDPVSGALYNFTGLRKAQPIKVNPL